MNSIWRNIWARLGVSTTPANWVRLDSSAAAALTARVGSAADSISPMLRGSSWYDCTASRESTNMR